MNHTVLWVMCPIYFICGLLLKINIRPKLINIVCANKNSSGAIYFASCPIKTSDKVLMVYRGGHVSWWQCYNSVSGGHESWEPCVSWSETLATVIFDIFPNTNNHQNHSESIWFKNNDSHSPLTRTQHFHYSHLQQILHLAKPKLEQSKQFQ